MKTFLLSVLAICLLSACKKSAPGGSIGDHTMAGVGVGNGLKSETHRYQSPHEFKVTYSDGIVLDVSQDQKSVTLKTDNRGMGRVSEIQIRVLQVGKDYAPFSSSGNLLDHLPGLRAMAESEVPNQKFVETSIPGARGLFFLDRVGDSVRAHYFFLTPSLNVLSVKVDSYADSQGIEKMESVIRSLSCDVKGPELHEIRVKGRAEAGKMLEIEFRLTDDISGVATSDENTGWHGSLEPVDRGQSIPILAALKSREDGWYALEVPLHKYQSGGEFVLSDLMVWDRAGNVTRLSGSKSYQNGVAALVVKIENEGIEDNEPPTVLEFREAGSQKAGQPAEFHFKALDDLSGIADRLDWVGFLRLHENGVEVHVLVEGTVRSLGDDWYALTFALDKYKPSGRYTLDDFLLFDRAGNSVHLRRHGDRYDNGAELLKVNVVNEGRADVTAPLITALRPRGEYRSGGVAMLEFCASDDFSGIPDELDFVGTFRSKSGDRGGEIMLEGAVTGLGNDCYFITFAISEFHAVGIYDLSDFQLFDNAGNTIRLQQRGETYSNGLPTVSIEIRRD